VQADPDIQMRLLDLQGLDTRLDQLAHRRRTLPAAARAAEVTARISTVGDTLIAARTLEGDIRVEVERAERDVASVRERAAHDEALLTSGSVSNPKQLESLRMEVESLARRQSDLEDVELEILDRLDRAEQIVAQLVQERDGLVVDLAQVEGERDQEYAEIDAEIAEVRRGREDLAGSIPGELLALYERLRADNGGVGAAPVHRGRCEGCRLDLSPADKEHLRQAPASEVVRCEECRRILVRTPESGLGS
jgi:hypothetical protein